MILDEKALLEKLRRIEALHAGATTSGERDAATNAIRHIQRRLALAEKEAPPIEYKLNFGDQWTRKLFLALARRYGMAPFRYRGQRYTTVMLRAPKRFMDETLWPEYLELSKALREALERVTDQALKVVFERETADADVREEPRAVGPMSEVSD